jgi:potassium efflux system protein
MSISETKVDEISLNTIIKTLFNIKTLISIIILVIAYTIARIVSSRFDNIKVKRNKKIVMSTISNIVYYFILFLGVSISLINAGFQIGSMIALLSTIGVALALGLQNTITQFVSGLIIIYNNTYNIDDYIITNGTEGTVSKFNLLTTTIINDDEITITIPNDVIVNSNLTNITKQQIVKIRVFFTIKNIYGFNITKFIELVKKTTLLCEYIVNKNINVYIENISHNVGTKIAVLANVYSKDYTAAK